VEKFGGKEVGRRGQGGWIKGDPRRSGRRPPTVPRPMVTRSETTGRLKARRPPVARRPQATAYVDRARHFFYKKIWDLFFYFLKALACRKGLGCFGGCVHSTPIF
jgi:hypothetical protein